MPYRDTPKSILIAAPVLAGIIGAAYRFGDPLRTMSPTFDAGKSIASMHTWGLVFLAGAVVLTAALISHKAIPLAVAWFAGGVLYVWWGSCMALQALKSNEASLVIWALYGWVAINHFIISQRCWRNRKHRRPE